MKDIIFGKTLGDLHISRIKDRPNITANLVFRQSIIQKDYFYYLYDLFKLYRTDTEPYIAESEISGKKYIALQFATRVFPLFNYYHDLFYIDNIKVVPYGIDKLLTPRALAFWFMDDGTTSRSNGNIVSFYLCTDSFSYSDVYYLCHILETNFKLKCSVHSNKNNPR